MLAQLTRSAAAVGRRNTLQCARLASTTASDGSEPKPQKQQRKNVSSRGKNLLFGDDGKDKDGSKKAAAPVARKKKTFSFSKVNKAEPEVPLEVFDYPAYWDQDFPEGFDDAMKHEVEKLQIFSDFTPYLDLSWQKEIHPLFDGENIKLTLNCPLEDFDERLFVDDKNTYDTKVSMEVPLSCFVGLNKQGLEIVKQLAGPRFQANKNQLKLTEDRYNTRVFNHKRLCDILRDITATAHELSAQQSVETAAAE